MDHILPTDLASRVVLRLAVWAIAGFFLAAGVRAEPLVFDIAFPGKVAGQLTLNAQSGPGTYDLDARVRSDPPLGAETALTYGATASGRTDDRGFFPAQFEAVADTGRRRSDSAVAFRAGLPRVIRDLPARPAAPGDVDPALIGGALDPLTALFVILRDQPISQACRLKAYLFDGRRLSQVVLFQPQIEDGAVTCRGEYRRLKGFSPDEMTERQRFAFSLIYRAAGPGMVRLAEGRGETLYGPARLKRR
jgi:Protein of unknown function (DUF3108)